MTARPMTDQAAEAAIRVDCRELHLPTIAEQGPRIADDATRERLTHRGFLAEVLAAEVDERAQRRRARRLLEAHFPRMKRLEDFDCTVTPSVPPTTVATLAQGAFIDAGAPVVLLGDSGTGKSHLLIGMGVAACEAGRRVRCVDGAGQRARRGRRRAHPQPRRDPAGPLPAAGGRPIPSRELCRPVGLGERAIPGGGGDLGVAGRSAVGIVTGLPGRRAACRWGGSDRAGSRPGR